MSDMQQRAQLLNLLWQMEVDAGRMYEAAAEKAEGDVRDELRAVHERHEAHVDTLERLLGECEVEEHEVGRDVRDSLDAHVASIAASRGAEEALARLVQAERTIAAEYSVAEGSQLQEHEQQEVQRLHEDTRGIVQQLEQRLSASAVHRAER